MKGAMKCFYNTNASAYRLIHNDSYAGKTTKSFICEFLCDIQISSGDISYGADGARIKREVKMYFDNAGLEVGDFIEADNRGYIITEIENRTLGSLAYLKGCEIYES